MKKLCIVAGALASIMAINPANAAVTVFTISNGSFDDGTGFSGSFSYDDVTDTYSDANVSVQNGTLTAFNYTNVGGANFFGSPSVLIDTGVIGRYINLVFASTLASTGAPVNFVITGPNNARSYECDNCSVVRYVTSGSVMRAAVTAVPEPSTWAMVLIGFGMMGASVRYRARSTKAVYA